MPPKKKTPKKKTAVKKTAPVEVVSPEDAIALGWHTARNTLAATKHHGRLFIVGQVLLGLQLPFLKKALGFQNGGNRRSESQRETLIESWEDHLNSELGITKSTAYRFETLAHAARNRVKRLGGQNHLLGLFEKSPSDLDEEALKTLEALVEKITDGQTQKSLLQELALVKKPSKGNGGHHPGDEDEEDDEQLAFDFFRPIITSLAEARVNKAFDHSLSALPLHGDEEADNPGLLDLQNHLEATLHEVKTVIKSKRKPKK